MEEEGTPSGPEAEEVRLNTFTFLCILILCSLIQNACCYTVFAASRQAVINVMCVGRLLQVPIRIGTRDTGITGIKVMEITGTMATTIKAMMDTAAMITRVTTTTTDMVTTAVCNTVCERTDEKTKDILYRGLSVLDPDYDSCALNYLSRMHMLVSYIRFQRNL